MPVLIVLHSRDEMMRVDQFVDQWDTTTTAGRFDNFPVDHTLPIHNSVFGTFHRVHSHRHIYPSHSVWFVIHYIVFGVCAKCSYRNDMPSRKTSFVYYIYTVVDCNTGFVANCIVFALGYLHD